MIRELCVCPLIPSLTTKTELLLLLHYREERKPTNTGRLAVLALNNSRVVVTGDRERPLPLPLVKDDRQPLLLYPAEDALPLDVAIARLDHDRAVTLIVPDGNWRQASKARMRIPGLREVPCVTLPAGPPTSYRLRHEPKEGGLATLEAIARALAILEGRHVHDALLVPFLAMVERTLGLRGQHAQTR